MPRTRRYFLLCFLPLLCAALCLALYRNGKRKVSAVSGTAVVPASDVSDGVPASDVSGNVPASGVSDGVPVSDASGVTVSDASGVTVSDASGNAVIPASAANWGLSFPKEGETPVGNATQAELAQYDAHFLGDTGRKVLYLTFDCGYENGYTNQILDALKKHHAPAAFFVVGNMVETAPDIVRRMGEEGHIVGNHTYHHPDMSKIAAQEDFEQELESLAALYQETTGRALSHYYRPPQGKYSVENLKQAKALGYRTIFWSLAYVDWYQDNQPTHEAAYAKLLPRIHNGAIVLLHSTSRTNAEILDDLLTRWETMGFTFASLDDLPQSEKAS